MASSWFGLVGVDVSTLPAAALVSGIKQTQNYVQHVIHLHYLGSLCYNTVSKAKDCELRELHHITPN